MENSEFVIRQAAFETFGEEIFSPSLFHINRGSLRFRLGSDSPRFIQMSEAVLRASILCDRIFAGTSVIFACLSTFSQEKDKGIQPILDALPQCDVEKPETPEIWSVPYDASFHSPEEKWYRIFACFPVTPDTAPCFIWSTFAAEAGIRPTVGATVHLFSLDEPVVVAPQPQLSFDVVSPVSALKISLHKMHSDWLHPGCFQPLSSLYPDEIDTQA